MILKVGIPARFCADTKCPTLKRTMLRYTPLIDDFQTHATHRP